MALSKASELRELSSEEITAEIAKIKRDLFDLRFKKATRQMETGFHEFRHTRRKLAQLMTIERERQLSDKKQAKAAEKEAQ
jgi:large subunit ribosomal protein L29